MLKGSGLNRFKHAKFVDEFIYKLITYNFSLEYNNLNTRMNSLISRI